MESWRKRFMVIWTGQAFSLLGSGLVNFALIWWLTEKTHSETVLAVSTLVALLPTVILGPFIGTLVDRWNRKRIMIVADSSVALLSLALILGFQLGRQDIWLVLAVNFLRALGGAFHHPAMLATTTLLVPPEHLTRVGGMNRILNGLLRILVPPAGALLLSVLSIEAILLIDVLTAAVAVGTLLGIKIPQPTRPAGNPSARHPSVRQDMVEGLRYVRHHPSLFYVVMTCTLANIFLGPAMSFKPLLITRIFHGGALELSYMNSLTGIGVIAGGLIISVWGGFRRRLITSGLGWLGVGICYVVISGLPESAFGWLLILSLGTGLTSSIGGAPLDAFYQVTVPHDKQGRVFAVLAALDNLTVPIGLILAALLGGRLSLRVWFLLVGLSHAILGISWVFSRTIKRAEDPAPVNDG